MLKVRFFDRNDNILKVLELNTDCLTVDIPEEKFQPNLEITVNTDAVLVDSVDEFGTTKVSMHEYSHLLADLRRENCKRCGSALKDGFCIDETCPFIEYTQDDPQGMANHPVT